MKNRFQLAWLDSRLLHHLTAGLILLVSVCPSTAAQPTMSRPSADLIEIRGGAGPASWVLHYGDSGDHGYGDPKPQFVLGSQNRAWFSHAGWLRLIDTDQGVVIGR